MPPLRRYVAAAASARLWRPPFPLQAFRNGGYNGLDCSHALLLLPPDLVRSNLVAAAACGAAETISVANEGNQGPPSLKAPERPTKVRRRRHAKRY